MRFEIRGIENVGKFISSLIDRNNEYTFHVLTDYEQAHQVEDQRFYIVEVASKSNEEQFVLEREED
jgi:hypothetical protein